MSGHDNNEETNFDSARDLFSDLAWEVGTRAPEAIRDEVVRDIFKNLAQTASGARKVADGYNLVLDGLVPTADPLTQYGLTRQELLNRQMEAARLDQFIQPTGQLSRTADLTPLEVALHNVNIMLDNGESIADVADMLDRSVQAIGGWENLLSSDRSESLEPGALQFYSGNIGYDVRRNAIDLSDALDQGLISQSEYEDMLEKSIQTLYEKQALDRYIAQNGLEDVSEYNDDVQAAKNGHGYDPNAAQRRGLDLTIIDPNNDGDLSDAYFYNNKTGQTQLTTGGRGRNNRDAETEARAWNNYDRAPDWVKKLIPGVSGAGPVILDLDGDGIETSRSTSVAFDMDDDGYVEHTAWVSADDALLVIDLNSDGSRGSGDGTIDQTREVVLSEWGEEFDTDLQALDRVFDDNGDHRLTAADNVWSELRVWQDVNQNGVSEQGELKSLSELGITEIGLRYDDGSDYGEYDDDLIVYSNALLGRASYTRNGVTVAGGVGDVNLGFENEGVIRAETSYGFQIEREFAGIQKYVELSKSSSADKTITGSTYNGVYGDSRNNDINGIFSDNSLIIDGGAGRDEILGSHLDDYIIGGDGSDQIDAQRGNDTIVADFLDLLSDDQAEEAGLSNWGMVRGGEGTDTLIITGDQGVHMSLKTKQVEIVFATEGDDILTSGNLAISVQISGNGGNDEIRSASGNDIISGGSGNDTAFGLSGDDQLFGDAGSDRLTGNSGDDILYGGAGSDSLWGSDGNDLVAGDNGHDQLAGNDGIDVLLGGDGDDNLFGGSGDGYVLKQGAARDFDNAHFWDVGTHERKLGDVDGDGKADIIGFGTSRVYIALGQSDGTFSEVIGSTTSLTTGWSASKHERDVADVNGDGFADLVGFGGSATFVALGNGDGSFQNLKRASTNFDLGSNWDVDVHERKL